MAGMTEIICACGCGQKRMVRTADVKRGWGKYYDKSCKGRGDDGFQKIESIKQSNNVIHQQKKIQHWCDYCSGNIYNVADARSFQSKLFHSYCYEDAMDEGFNLEEDDPSWDAHKDSF